MTRRRVTWEEAERLYPTCSAAWDRDGGPEWLCGHGDMTLEACPGALVTDATSSLIAHWDQDPDPDKYLTFGQYAAYAVWNETKRYWVWARGCDCHQHLFNDDDKSETVEIIPYASRTGTKKNLDGLRARGWRLLVSATGAHRTEGFRNYAIDNGAWTAFQQKKPFDSHAFIRCVVDLGAGADWVAVPDVVAGGKESLRLSLKWLAWVLRHTAQALIPVQDDMAEGDIRDLIGGRIGIFVGGSRDWKLRTMAGWCRLAKEKNVWCHVGRVNSMQRIRHCQMSGATSFDGTNATIYSKNQSKLTWAVRQRTLNLEEP